MTLPATDAAWLHDLSPWVWRISGDVGIRWYGLAYVMGFVIAYALFRWLAGRGATLVPRERVLDAIMLGIVGVVVGGRLGYVLVYDQSLLGFTDSFPFWNVLALNRGGMASHGGMLGVIVAAWRISRGFRDDAGTVVGRCPPLHVMDVLAMICPFGLLLGRVANFVNAELLGAIVARPGEPAPWWSVRFSQELTQFPPEYLPQSDEQWVQIQQLAVTQLDANEQALLLDDEAFDAVMYEAYERLIEAVQRGNSAVSERIEPLISARAPSQLLQALAEGLILAGVLWFIARKPRVPGVVGAWFLITYGALRIATEFVRLPDAGLGRTLGMSRGQWLSVLMIGAGFVVLAWVIKRGGERVGGWLSPAQPAPDPGSSDS